MAATGYFLHVHGIITDVNQPQIAEERVPLGDERHIVAIFVKSDASAGSRS